MARKEKPRKWANLKGQIPDDPSQTELTPRTLELLKRADARRTKPDGTPIIMDDLADEWAGLEEEEEFEDLAKTDRNITFDALTKRILEELERIKTLAGTDFWRGKGQTFSPKFMINVRIVDPIALRRWVKDTDQEHLLSVPAGRLKGIVGEALNPELAANKTPAERAALKPGEPGSMKAPPGVEVTLFSTVHHTNPGKKTRQLSGPSSPEDDPF